MKSTHVGLNLPLLEMPICSLVLMKCNYILSLTLIYINKLKDISIDNHTLFTSCLNIWLRKCSIIIPTSEFLAAAEKHPSFLLVCCCWSLDLGVVTLFTVIYLKSKSIA